MSMYPSIPITPAKKVMVLWGNPQRGVIHLGTTEMNMAMRIAREWFSENDHFFHLEYFPPYDRMWGDESCITIDYGSHSNFVYCIPI